MNCTCGGSGYVVDTRTIGSVKCRRRMCDTCGARWSTQEVRVDKARLPDAVRAQRAAEARKRANNRLTERRRAARLEKTASAPVE